MIQWSKLRPARLRYVYGWRLRHWWYDTRQGAQARIVGLCLLAFAFIAEMIQQAVAALAPDPQQPHQAVIGVIIVLIVALLVGVALALSMHQNAKPPGDAQVTGPTTQDGKSAPRLYGTCNITNPAELAWKVVGRVGIKQKGGK